MEATRARTPLSRSDFPVLETSAYLNAGSVGPLSVRTHQAILDALARDLAGGRGALSRMHQVGPLGERVRGQVAELLGVAAENVLLTSSTTEGCNIVLSGFPLEPGDEVVTTDAEHPALEEPLKRCGVLVRQARVLERPAGEALEAVLAEVTPRTRLVALSHVLWLNGHVLPVGEIKRQTGLPMLVDGAQSAGAIPVAAREVDYYTVSGQKWLCGPEQTGALYVADPDSLRPRLGSYAAGVREDASRLSLTFANPALVAGLSVALEDLPPTALVDGRRMSDRCRAALIAAGVEVVTEPGQGTLVSFRVPGDPAELAERAEAAGVVIRNLPNGALRASCGWWTSDEDIARLVVVIT